MTNYKLCLLLVILTSVEPFCSRNSRNRWMERKTRGCQVHESKNGVGSGRVSNLTAKCHYNTPKDVHHHHNNFFYKLSWEQQRTTTTPVTEYRIKIWYENYIQYLCFFVPASQRQFVFNQTMGLATFTPRTFTPGTITPQQSPPETITPYDIHPARQ